jgi:hypothetical protein
MKKKFSTIALIDLEKPHSWQDTSFITLDIDWCHDEVLAYTINLLEQEGASATWFVTHDTPLLERLRANPKFELGIHPNFNFLLQGDSRNGKDAEEVVDRMLEIVPEAKSVRSHSMTQNSRLLDLFAEKGITHESNHFIPYHTGIRVKPWKLWNNLCRVPYNWEDDVHIMYSKIQIHEHNPSEIVLSSENNGLMVFDFHPIHVFLNAESIDRYEQSRSMHHNPKKLINHRFKGYGTSSRFADLLKLSL